ncbi:MAG: hypothetical protein PHT78_13615, partial [Desulfitobacteriaceae bacterium]|nr:hypothetical protein [Desulfitobacteriaceae bacterium]
EELKDKKINTNIIEERRRRYIINNVIYPSIEEILITLESNITADELIEYKNLVEEGLRYGD